jgi:D-glycero-alpha-D-manno-heptose 1-phosphate guanylyltransferase
MKRPDTAIVLAGGLGTRLRAAVPGLPKPLAPLNGRPFLAHLLDYWCGQGVSRFILSVGYLHEMIEDTFGSLYRGAAIEYAVEETPLGTGGGLLLALQKLRGGEPVLLLNGDTFFAVDRAQLAAFHAQRGAQCSLTLFRSAEAGRYMGVRLGADGVVETLADGRAELGGLANGGVYLLEPAVFTGFAAGEPLSFEQDVLPTLFARKAAIYGMECAGRFIDIGVPADYARAPEIIL